MKDLVFMFLLLGLLLAVSSQPIPQYFTQASSISITDKFSPQMVVYSPDQKSLICSNQTSLFKCFTFRTGLLQNETQKEYCIDSYIVSLKYAPEGNRLYLLTTALQQSANFNLSFYSIIAGGIFGNARFVAEFKLQKAAQFQGAWDVGKGKRIAAAFLNKFFIVTISAQGAITTNSYDSVGHLSDLKWHTADTQLLFVGCCVKTDNSLQIYNSNTKQFVQYIDTPNYSINMINNGSLILLRKQDPQVQAIRYVNVYNYQSGVITFANGFKDYDINWNRGTFVSEKSNIVGLDKWNSRNNTYEVHLVEILPVKENTNTASSQSQKINPNPNYKSPSLSQTYELKIQFVLDLSGLVGTYNGAISSDGNEIYLNKWLYKTSNRWTRCKDGKYLSNGECLNCSYQCKTCHQQNDTCMSCYNETYYSNQLCYNCGTKYNGCENCSSLECYKCSSVNNFVPEPVKNTCVCQPGTYRKSNSQCKHCTDTLIGCVRCLNSQTCLQCDSTDDYVLEDNKCKTPIGTGAIVLIVLGAILGVVILGGVGYVVYRKFKKGKAQNYGKLDEQK